MQRALSADADVSCRAEMMVEHPVNLGKFCVPLVPVMASGHNMKFVLKTWSAARASKLSVGRQQPLLVTSPLRC